MHIPLFTNNVHCNLLFNMYVHYCRLIFENSLQAATVPVYFFKYTSHTFGLRDSSQAIGNVREQQLVGGRNVARELSSDLTRKLMRPMQLNSDAMHWMHWENQGHSLRGDVTHSCLRTGCHWNKSRPSHCQLTKTNKQFCHSMSALALSAEYVKRISHPDLRIYWFWLEVNESMLAI